MVVILPHRRRSLGRALRICHGLCSRTGRGHGRSRPGVRDRAGQLVCRMQGRFPVAGERGQHSHTSALLPPPPLRPGRYHVPRQARSGAKQRMGGETHHDQPSLLNRTKKSNFSSARARGRRDLRGCEGGRGSLKETRHTLIKTRPTQPGTPAVIDLAPPMSLRFPRSWPQRL